MSDLINTLLTDELLVVVASFHTGRVFPFLGPVEPITDPWILGLPACNVNARNDGIRRIMFIYRTAVRRLRLLGQVCRRWHIALRHQWRNVCREIHQFILLFVSPPLIEADMWDMPGVSLFENVVQLSMWFDGKDLGHGFSGPPVIGTTEIFPVQSRYVVRGIDPKVPAAPTPVPVPTTIRGLPASASSLHPAPGETLSGLQKESQEDVRRRGCYVSAGQKVLQIDTLNGKPWNGAAFATHLLAYEALTKAIHLSWYRRDLMNDVARTIESHRSHKVEEKLVRY